MTQDSLGLDIVAQSDHPSVRSFADLWDSKRRGENLPSRSDFEIEELLPWFGHVIIMDVIDGASDFRYRMIGTSITQFLNRDYTGERVSQSRYGEGRDKVVDTFRRPVLAGAPVFRAGRVIWATDKTWRRYDSVHCPLTRDSEVPAFTIGVLYFGSIALPDADGPPI